MLLTINELEKEEGKRVGAAKNKMNNSLAQIGVPMIRTKITMQKKVMLVNQIENINMLRAIEFLKKEFPQKEKEISNGYDELKKWCEHWVEGELRVRIFLNDTKISAQLMGTDDVKLKSKMPNSSFSKEDIEIILKELNPEEGDLLRIKNLFTNQTMEQEMLNKFFEVEKSKKENAKIIEELLTQEIVTILENYQEDILHIF